MQLICDKYKETMESEDAECRHPDDYCQIRSSCIISYMEKERKREQARQEKKTAQEEKS
ncbi:MAG: RNA polymerase II-associated protein [Thermodesulfobacteriota bacterium]|nr:RNA polymerase II-associated protein [Thermodesulfobacteriota bacterium]